MKTATINANQTMSSCGHALQDTRLRRATTLFAAAVAFHNIDHFRRGLNSAPSDVLVVGMLSILLELALVVLVFQRHRLAPLAAIVGGAFLAIGYLDVHFLPPHSFMSDSFVGVRWSTTSLWSESAALFETVAAAILAFAGLAVLRARGGLASASRRPRGHVRLTDAMRQPVPLALIAVHALGYLSNGRATCLVSETSQHGAFDASGFPRRCGDDLASRREPVEPESTPTLRPRGRATDGARARGEQQHPHPRGRTSQESLTVAPRVPIVIHTSAYGT